MSHIAIDFGTARTKIARLDNESGRPVLINLGREIQWVVPSLFYIPKQGPVLIGDDALEAFKADPGGVVRGLKMELHRATPIRRNLRRFDRIELAARLFDWIRRECDRLVFHRDPVTRCTLTVPPGFGEFQIGCIKAAAEHGGFQQIDTIEEPVSAARSWFATAPTATRFITVCDIGGGTSDIALVERVEGSGFFIFPDIPPQGIPRGGNDIDDFILDRLEIKDFPEAVRPGLLVRIRQSKERVTTLQQPVRLSAAGKQFEVTPEMVAHACRDFMEVIVPHLKRFLEKFHAVPSIRAEDVPLLLVGGGRYIIGAREALATQWPAEVYCWEDAERATVLGALISDKIIEAPQQGPVEQYKKAVAELTQEPATNAARDEIEGFLIKLNELENIRRGLPQHFAQLFDNIETARWGKTADHLRDQYRIIIERLDRLQKSIEWYQRALKAWKQNPNPDLKEVIKACEIATDFTQDFYPALFLEALVSGKEGEFQTGLELMDRYLDGVGPSRELLLLRGLFRLRTGQASQAILAVDDFTQAMKSQKDPVITDIEPKTDVSDSKLVLLRAYAYYLGSKPESTLNGLHALTLQYRNNKDAQAAAFPIELLLALRCIISLSCNAKGIQELFEELFCLRPYWSVGFLKFDSHFSDLPRWRKYFSDIESKEDFADRLKNWLISALQNIYPNNRRQQISSYCLIVFKSGDRDPWKLDNNRYLGEPLQGLNNDGILDLIRVASVMSETHHEDLAERYLLRLFQIKNDFDYSILLSDPWIKKLLTRPKLRPTIVHIFDASFFFGMFFEITNKSPFSVTNVVVSFEMKEVGSGRIYKITAPYPVPHLAPGETVDIKKVLPREYSPRTHKIKNIFCVCDEQKLLP